MKFSFFANTPFNEIIFVLLVWLSYSETHKTGDYESDI